MSTPMSHLPRTARPLGRVGLALAGVATAGSLVLAGAPSAQAATYDAGYSQSERHTTNGTGDADAAASATDHGRITLTTKARGGDTGGVLGATSQETRGSAVGSFGRRVSVGHGTYRIVVTYRDLHGIQRDDGSSAEAVATRTSRVRFVAQTGEDAAVHRTQQVRGQDGTRRTTLFLTVPRDSSGYLRLQALLRAVSTADGAGNTAKAQAATSGISFKVTRG